jgi:hypothetical protein
MDVHDASSVNHLSDALPPAHVSTIRHSATTSSTVWIAAVRSSPEVDGAAVGAGVLACRWGGGLADAAMGGGAGAAVGAWAGAAVGAAVAGIAVAAIGCGVGGVEAIGPPLTPPQPASRSERRIAPTHSRPIWNANNFIMTCLLYIVQFVVTHRWCQLNMLV